MPSLPGSWMRLLLLRRLLQSGWKSCRRSCTIAAAHAGAGCAGWSKQQPMRPGAHSSCIGAYRMQHPWRWVWGLPELKHHTLAAWPMNAAARADHALHSTAIKQHLCLRPDQSGPDLQLHSRSLSHIVLHCCRCCNIPLGAGLPGPGGKARSACPGAQEGP